MPRKARSLNKTEIIVATAAATAVLGLIAVNLAIGEKKVTRSIDRLYAIEDEEFQRTMGLMMGPAVIGGNHIEALINGDQIFPSMLSAIRSAQKTITLESFIYWSESIGDEFADALVERSRAGVRVHLLVDAVGSSKLDGKQIAKMEDAGVELRKYRPFSWYNLAKMNNRTHRKLLVVDGRIGFTGGVGIAGQWTGNAQDPQHWRDSHFRVEGPVVAQMQSVLINNWTKTTGVVLHGADYFPALVPVGDQLAQVFSSSPTGGSESMALMYLLTITAATTSIDLSNSYFLPDALLRQALVAAMQRGVRLRIITPGEHMDEELVGCASRQYWGELLAAGAEMYEYQPTMFHCKMLIVDQLLVSVGSTNFDERSFRLNDEANLNIFDAGFAQAQTAVFENDLRNARRMSLAQWRARPRSDKIKEFFTSRFDAFL